MATLKQRAKRLSMDRLKELDSIYEKRKAENSKLYSPLHHNVIKQELRERTNSVSGHITPKPKGWHDPRRPEKLPRDFEAEEHQRHQKALTRAMRTEYVVRDSDGMKFKVVKIKEEKQIYGSTDIIYLLESPLGGQLTVPDSWIDKHAKRIYIS